jgi:hypothetical protein
MSRIAHQTYSSCLIASFERLKLPSAIDPRKALMNKLFHEAATSRHGQIDVGIDWVGFDQKESTSGGAIRGWIAPMNTLASYSDRCRERSSGAISYPIAQGKGS